MWRHKSFGHVDIFFEAEDGTVILVNASPWQMGVMHIDKPLGVYLELLKAGSRSNHCCLKMKSSTEEDNEHQRGAVNCVSIVKAILGLRGVFIITPYQLFKLIKRKGGQTIWQQQQSH